MKALQKISKYHGGSIRTKIRTVKAKMFPVAFYGSRSWTLENQNEKHIDTLNFGIGKES